MNKQKMLEVAEIIESAKPENFAMGSWFGQVVDRDNLWQHEYILDTDVETFLEEYDTYDYFVVHDDVELSELKDIVQIESEKVNIACDTTACIAGWTIISEWANDSNFFDKEYIEKQNSGTIMTMARDILGLTTSEAYSLFYCEPGSLWDRLSYGHDFKFDPNEPLTWIFDNKKVAGVLKAIANGKISIIDEDWDPETAWLNENEAQLELE